MGQEEKKLFGWTNASLGHAQCDQKKFEYINSIFEGRWPTYRNFEICASFFRDARTFVLRNEDGSDGPLLFDALVYRVQKECDFTHPAAKKHSVIFQNLSDIFAAFRTPALEALV